MKNKEVMVWNKETYTVYKRNGKYEICSFSFNHLLDPEEIIETNIKSYSSAKWIKWRLEL